MSAPGRIRILLASAAVFATATAVRPARAAQDTIAVADFDYADSSGEVTDQRAAHAERLHGLQASVMAALTATGRLEGVALACATPPCSAGAMDQDAIANAAHAQHARFVVFGGVHKISTLIQWGQVEVMDAASGKSVLSRTVTFRGDSDNAWQHAADYIGQMVVAALP